MLNRDAVVARERPAARRRPNKNGHGEQSGDYDAVSQRADAPLRLHEAHGAADRRQARRGRRRSEERVAPIASARGHDPHDRHRLGADVELPVRERQRAVRRRERRQARRRGLRCARARSRRAVLAPRAGHAARLSRRRRSKHWTRDGVRDLVQRLLRQPRGAARDLPRLRAAGRQTGAHCAPCAHESRRRQGLLLEARHRRGDARVLSVDDLLEFRRAHAARRRARFLRADGLREDRRRPLYLPAHRVRALRRDDALRARLEPRRADRRAARLRRERRARVLRVHGQGRVARPDRAIRAVRRPRARVRHGARSGQRARTGQRARAEGRAPRLPADAQQLDALEGAGRGRSREEHERVPGAQPDGRQRGAREQLSRGQDR